MPSKLSRREILRGAGGLGAIVLGSGAVGAEQTEEPTRHIVGTSSKAAVEAARQQANSVHRVLDFGDIGQAVAGVFPEAAREKLRQRDDVRYIEVDGEMRAIGHGGGDQTIPWGIDRVDADVAHHNGYTGDGADIAIIDTGIDSDHPDLQANLGTDEAIVSCEPLGNRGGCRFGLKPNDNPCNAPWDDDNDHGTHVAGTANAVNNDSHVVGVSTEATLHAVKVLDGCGSGSFSDVADGILWVADQGYDVANMSLGGSKSSTVEDAVEYAYGKGVLLVASAGNQGPCTDCVGYPAAEPEVIAVSATSSDDSLASFSSTGSEVELAAPGESILSTVPPESSSDGLDTFSGTSMASPHVAGAGGQLMALGFANVDDTTVGNPYPFNPGGARGRLQDVADDIGLTNDEQGDGLLDVDGAIPLDVVTRDASNLTESSAKLHGNLTSLGDVDSVEVRFRYWEKANKSGTYSFTSWHSLSSPDTFSETVGDLKDDTTYEFIAEAKQPDGDNTFGEYREFTTPLYEVDTDPATDITESSASLNGELLGLGGADSVDVRFRYWEKANKSGTYSFTSWHSLSSPNTFSETVGHLKDDTTYEFIAEVKQPDGDNRFGEYREFTSPLYEVDTDPATDITESSASLNGELLGLGGADSVDVRFRYWEKENKSGTYSFTSWQDMSSTGTFSETVADLKDDTTYEFIAEAKQSDGDNEFGEYYDFHSK